jgi:two-component system, NarL family, sensor kinase
MKAHKPHTDGPYGTNVRKLSRIGPDDACCKSYWMHAPEFLFSFRASHPGQFIYESINPAFECLLGIASEDIREKTISDCMSDEDAKSICVTCDACLAEGRAVRCRHTLTLGGHRQDFETSVAPIRDHKTGTVTRLIGSHRALDGEIARDTGERAAIRRSPANFNIRLLSLQEEIQQRIASDLHDSTCQHLIAANLHVMRLRRAMNGIGSVNGVCDDIDASIDRALNEIRSFTYLLYPQNLTADGLKMTIEQFVSGFEARTSLKTYLQIAPGVDKLPYEKQRSVLRVIQEALMNVFRHAKATQVKIAMEARDTHFRLRISDDGRGMPIGQARSGSKAISLGVGILAMRARVQQMGGGLEINSSSASECQGTTLCATIPRTAPRTKVRRPERRHSQLGSTIDLSRQH